MRLLGQPGLQPHSVPPGLVPTVLPGGSAGVLGVFQLIELHGYQNCFCAELQMCVGGLGSCSLMGNGRFSKALRNCKMLKCCLFVCLFSLNRERHLKAALLLFPRTQERGSPRFRGTKSELAFGESSSAACTVPPALQQCKAPIPSL